MFDFADPSLDREKCFISIGALPSYVDSAQPPQKKPPFSAILGHTINHRVDLILPRELHQAVWSSMIETIEPLQYARAIFPLSAILEGEFFNKYIKIGNVLMISEGRSGVDNVYRLRDGILTLELDKASYESAGLVGKSIQAGDRKHTKSRYSVEINLRHPSMLHGKKGFERIVWAFKNALNSSVTWLFCDLSKSSSLTHEDAPIRKFHPQVITCSPIESVTEKVLTPPFDSDGLLPVKDRDALRDSCEELQEWLALVSLGSERILSSDSIDPYLSRYEVPLKDECKASDLVKVTWGGLIPSGWITNLLALLLRKCGPQTPYSQYWFGILVSALGKEAVDGKDGYAVLALPVIESKLEEKSDAENKESSLRRQFVCWEYVGGNVASF